MSPRILVVDDEPTWRESFQDILVGMGFDVWLAEGTKDAETLLEKGEYALILLDVALDQPSFSLSCQQFCDSLRRQHPQVPVVAATGKQLSPTEMWTLFGLGIADFVYKPEIQLADFRRRIQDALQETPRIRVLSQALSPMEKDTAHVTIFLDDDIQEFTLAEQATSFVSALSRLVNVNPARVRVLHIALDNVQITLEMPKEAMNLLISMYLNNEPVLQKLRIAKVEIRRQNSDLFGADAAIGIGEKNVATPGLAIIWEQRLNDLASHVRQDLAMLKNYEDKLRYEDDPRRQARYHQEIEQLRESAVRYQQQYNELQTKIVDEAPTAMQDVATQLQQMDARLHTLLDEQSTIRDDLSHLRQTLLARYDAGEQTVITAITERLAQVQLTSLVTVLDLLEADRLSEAEMRETLNAVYETLAALQQQGVSLPGQQAVAEAIDSPILGVKHKLKVTLPIIPLLLGYEGELELGSEVNLEAVWERLAAKVRGG